jgi:hypothetical protein
MCGHLVLSKQPLVEDDFLVALLFFAQLKILGRTPRHIEFRDVPTVEQLQSVGPSGSGTMADAGKAGPPVVTILARQFCKLAKLGFCGQRIKMRNWSGRLDSNQRPPAPEAGALPDCATPRTFCVAIRCRHRCVLNEQVSGTCEFALPT